MKLFVYHPTHPDAKSNGIIEYDILCATTRLTGGDKGLVRFVTRKDGWYWHIDDIDKQFVDCGGALSKIENAFAAEEGAEFKGWNDGLGNRKYSKECPGDVWVLGMDCPCSEERKEKMSIKRKMRVGWKHKEETKKKMMKSKCKYIYELQSPNGEVFITNNLTDFCKENPQYALNRRLMCAVAHGKQRYHKGWTVRILEHIS